MKILAAIVTHNRCELLERCIDHLQMQTRLPDLILVVNNGSNRESFNALLKKMLDLLEAGLVVSHMHWNIILMLFG